MREAVSNSCNYYEALRFLGIPEKGANSSTLKKIIIREGIDNSHFTHLSPSSWRRDCNKHPINYYLCKGSQIDSKRLKNKLILEGLKQNKCELCGVSLWRSKPLSLQLHHINGDHSDNRLDNLQILCPNCHSQTDNFAGKTTNKGERRCAICGETISRGATYCVKCRRSGFIKKTIETNVLLDAFKELKNYSAVGRIYGLSRHQVRRRIIEFVNQEL